MDNERFPFEDLEVWREAVAFADRCLDLIERIQTNRKHYRLIEQFESACTSPSLNIAEVKGRFSKKEFVQFLYIARGSLFETITLLILFKERGWVEDEILSEIKSIALRLAKRINALINTIKA